MLIILSPSKTMDMSGALDFDSNHFSEKTLSLIENLKTFSPKELSNLMKIKGKTLDSVVDIYESFEVSPYKKAIESYRGSVFKEIKLDDYSADEREFLDNHFVILSALYGAIPSDFFIREYRLDMTMKILSEENLYSFWKKEINKSLENLMKARGEETLINLASNEFSKLIDRKNFYYEIIDIDFKEEKEGKFKSVSTYAKKARGLMCNYIIKNKLEDFSKIKEFNEEGYLFNKELSSKEKYVFTRLGR